MGICVLFQEKLLDISIDIGSVHYGKFNAPGLESPRDEA